MKKDLSFLDYFIFVSVFLISVCIGLYNGYRHKFKNFFKQNKYAENVKMGTLKKTKSQISEYLIANSSMGSTPLAFSLLASFFSATTLLGMPAEVYQYGIQYWVIIFAMMIVPILGAYGTGPLFCDLKILSVFEYLEIRFNSKSVRSVGMICYLFKAFISTAIFIYGPATTLNTFTKLSNEFSIGLVGFVGTFYTTIGGIKGVIWTDLFQASIMFTSLFLIIITGVIDEGGVYNIYRKNLDGGRLNVFDFNFDPFIRQSFWSLFIGTLFYLSTLYCIDQQMLQRFQAAKSRKTAQRAVLMNIPGIVTITTLCCVIGLIVYAKYHKCDPLSSPFDRIKNPNQLASYYVMNTIKFRGASGLFLSSIFCGSLSSVSSSLNSISLIVWEDFLKSFSYFRKFNDKQSLKVTKLIALIFGVLSTSFAFIISTLGGNIIQVSFTLNGAFIAPILGIFILGCLFKISNSYGAIVGTVLGFMFGLWLSFGTFFHKPIYPKLNVSTESCSNETFNYSNLNLTHLNTFNSNIYQNNNIGLNKVYYLSYMWYTPVGVLVTVFMGLLVSLFTGGLNNKIDDSFILLDLFGFINKFNKVSSVDERNNVFF
jgi:sodium-coupled monocarboxylate transporter 8/12